ncbi:MAG: hypothetical protein K0S06_3160 [Microvirga sp.]|nr:hypothetical protein [Microvirga sp.]
MPWNGPALAGRIEDRLVRGADKPARRRSGDLIMELGPVELSAGSSSSDIRSSAKLTVTERTRVIKGADRAFLSVATDCRGLLGCAQAKS